MIQKFTFMSILWSGFIHAMQETDELIPSLADSFTVSIIKREDMENPFKLVMQNSATVGHLKKAISRDQKIPVECLIIRALPRHTGSAASYILSDRVLLATIISLYSNRFLLYKQT